MARIVTTRPGRASMTLSRDVSRVFDLGADGPAIADETRIYRAAVREWLRAHPAVESVEVYMSKRYGGSQTDVIYADEVR